MAALSACVTPQAKHDSTSAGDRVLTPRMLPLGSSNSGGDHLFSLSFSCSQAHHAAHFELNSGRGVWHSGLGGHLLGSHCAQGSRLSAVVATVARGCERGRPALEALWNRRPGALLLSGNQVGFSTFVAVSCQSTVQRGFHKGCRLSTQLTPGGPLLWAEKATVPVGRALGLVGMVSLVTYPFRVRGRELCHGLKA